MTPLRDSYPRVRAIVFDLDGTLYQNETMGEQVNLAACGYVADLKKVSLAEAERLIEEERVRHKEAGGTLSLSVAALGGNLKDLHRRLADEVRPEGVLTVDPRVPALLKALSHRYELDLYTNNNRKLSGRIMREIGVAGLFEKIFSIEDFWRAKPDRTALKAILEGIGRSPSETLFVGDRYEVDLKLPESLGCEIYEAATIEELLELEKIC